MKPPVPDPVSQRLRALEARVGRLEEAADAPRASLQALHREVTGLRLDLAKLLWHFQLYASIDREIDAAMDEL